MITGFGRDLAIITLVLLVFGILFYAIQRRKQSLRQKHESVSSLGNVLSVYFHLYSIAIYRGQDFEWKQPLPSYFLAQLPSKIPYDPNVHAPIRHQWIVEQISEEKLVTLRSDAAWFVNEDDLQKIWDGMHPLVHRILEEALVQSELKKTVKIPVIHFRCADTPFCRHDKYHFQKYIFFRDALQGHDKVILLSCHTHNSRADWTDACRQYSDSLRNYLTGIGVQVTVQCHESNLKDFATMFYAPLVISTGSSFSFMAGYFGHGTFHSAGHVHDPEMTSPLSSLPPWMRYDTDVGHQQVSDYLNVPSVIKLLHTS